MHLIDRAAGISARHPRLCSLVAGAMAACGFAPLSLWPLTLAGIACLIELTARAPSARRAFLIGWFFGFGLFTVGDN
jgi:apolipoprotein N-acyltransferase